MTNLSVNLNAVAQLRNRRNLPWPSVTGIAAVVIGAGARGITVHPRPDERHIRRADVFELAALLRGSHPGVEYNIEGYPTEDFLALVETVRPDQVTLVPDHPDQATSDHGWDFKTQQPLLTQTVGRLKHFGIRVSLFCDPDAHDSNLARARLTGADRVELFTGPYGATYGNPAEAGARLADLTRTATAAVRLGLGINAGHDLTLGNLPAFLRQVSGVAEVSIGHAITADALLFGFAEAVRRYIQVLGET